MEQLVRDVLSCFCIPKILHACVPEEKLITEQAVVKWILASLCQPSKLAIHYPAFEGPATMENCLQDL